MSRFDAVGLWWEDLPEDRKRGITNRPMPEIPETATWVAPTTFPDLTNAEVISLDTETYDPELLTRGPGWARGVGHIVGISVATSPADAWYFPMRHETRPEENLDPDMVLKWAKNNLEGQQPKVGANLSYDVGWLRQEGVYVGGVLLDVQYAEALLDDRARTALEVLGQKYLGLGKETEALYEWLSIWFGGKPDGKQRKYMHRAPPCLAGPYAESDAHLPLQVIQYQYAELAKHGLVDLFHMECKLIRVLQDMRFRGVRVDLEKAEKARDVFLGKEKEAQDKLDKYVGFNVNTNAGESLADAFNRLDLKYNTTAKGAPSFTAPFLETVTHPVGGLVREVRKYQKARSTFIESYILNSHVNGRVHGQFHPLRGDDGGAVSGRFASSTPNLQNIPARDKIIGPVVRSIFVPDIGDFQWRQYDYSQIEYRLLAHFAVGPGAAQIRQVFIDDPTADFHETVRQLIHTIVGILLDRKPTKNINFGLCYGMGQPKLTADLGLTKKAGKELFDAYHIGAPFVKSTFNYFSTQAANTGTVRTILGRVARFDLWEGLQYNKNLPALPYDDAVQYYGQVKRAYQHKALNRVLQGSAADIIKAAMVKCYEDGVFDATGIPSLTVHDELDFSDAGGCDDAFQEMAHIMETVVPCKVPLLVDCATGSSWGDLSDA